MCLFYTGYTARDIFGACSPKLNSFVLRVAIRPVTGDSGDCDSVFFGCALSVQSSFIRARCGYAADRDAENGSHVTSVHNYPRSAVGLKVRVGGWYGVPQVAVAFFSGVALALLPFALKSAACNGIAGVCGTH